MQQPPPPQKGLETYKYPRNIHKSDAFKCHCTLLKLIRQNVLGCGNAAPGISQTLQNTTEVLQVHHVKSAFRAVLRFVQTNLRMKSRQINRKWTLLKVKFCLSPARGLQGASQSRLSSGCP
jgi:hypothetical protein